jgi:predicted Holliday junction resolvase-like endonuclease
MILSLSLVIAALAGTSILLTVKLLRAGAVSRREDEGPIGAEEAKSREVLHETISGLREALADANNNFKIEKLDFNKEKEKLEQSALCLSGKLEEESKAKKKILSQKKSGEVRLGHIAEKLAPFLEDFTYNPENATFLGQPIDYIVFEDDEVVFVEIKSGNAQLSSKQRHIKKLVENNCVSWKTIRID